VVGADFDTVLDAARERGAAAAFARLHAAYAPLVAGYLRLQGAQEPDDLTNETFLAAFTGIASFSGDEAGFRAWLFTIAHRRLVDERRRRTRRPAWSESAGDPHKHPTVSDASDEALALVAQQRVMALCDQLPPDQRTVILLRIVADLTVDQTARAIGRSPGAVKQLQRRALITLRRLVHHEGVTL
jgi:RNA polymerase sigma factor (sigma-70 family)